MNEKQVYDHIRYIDRRVQRIKEVRRWQRKTMTKEQAYKILVVFNRWRRGGKGEMQDTKKLGKAIDVAIRVLKPRKRE